MITDTIINIAYHSLNSLIGLLPYGQGLPTEVHSAVTALGAYFGLLNSLVPMQTLATVVALVFAFELILFGFKTTRWLISYIPFLGGK